MGTFDAREFYPNRIMVGQGLTVFAVGAVGIFRIYFFSRLSFLFFFIPLSEMDEWVACGLSPFQQNFSDIRTLSG